MARFGTQDWTHRQLNAHKDRLWRVLNKATAMYNSLPPEFLLAFNGRCAADVMNSLVIATAQKEFDGVAESDFWLGNNTTYHVIKDCVLWYKQLNEDHLPSNYPTPAAREMMQGRFDFMPDRILLVLGFELDPFKKRITRVEIQRFGHGQQLQFVIEITKSAAPISVMPATTATAAKTRVRRKVVLRKGFEQKQIEPEG